MKHLIAAALFALLATPFFANAGATGGKKSANEIVKAGQTDRYQICFNANEPARLVVKGDGDTDLDLYVYDENGNLIDSDTDGTDTCVASWNPRWTGNFAIRVVNRGNVYNRYTLLTN